MRKIVVCDDEAYIREQLCAYLSRVEQALKQQFSIAACASGEDLLTMVSDADIVLLDIQMGGLSGMRAAHILRQRHQDICIIFITSMVEYALEGYQVHAFGFLKKPIRYGTFLQQMQDALNMLTARHGTILTLQNGVEIARISSESIFYIEVFGHNIIVHQENQAQSYAESLSALESLLSAHGFFRCHKSYLIHLKFVQRILPASVVMADGAEIPVSKHRRRDFLVKFSCYTGELL